ncbi:MAG TPA: hypothetical protein VF128_13915 [Gemmatimonadaceae bacterium]
MKRIGRWMTVLGLASMAIPGRTMAREGLGGRFYITYQNSERPGVRREYLSERFEATLRDRVFERNDLALTFYLDNAKDLLRDETLRRYRGMLDIQNQYYSFNARYAPRQEITSLEIPGGVELLEKSVMLDVHPQNYPRVRLSYGQNERFNDNGTGNRTTNLRGDLFYTYKIFDMMLNRYVSTTANSVERRTTVTGANLGAAHSFGPQLTFDAGYQYQLSQQRPTPGAPQDITNNAFSGLVTSYYRRYVLGNVALNRRYITAENQQTLKTIDDNHRVSAKFLPFNPVNLEVADTYVQTKENGDVASRTHYGTMQLIADGTVYRKTRGLLQLTRQAEIETINSLVPDHIYFVRLESFDRRGVDLRAEAGVYERVQDDSRGYRYRNITLLDVYLRPRRNITIIPRMSFSKFSDTISFTKNDQATYGLNANWVARALTFGANLTHNELTTGRRSVNNAATFNVSARLRNRASFNVSYGMREADQFATGRLPWEYDKTNTLNVWGQVWVLPRGSVSVNYTHVDREQGDGSEYVALNYRQEF